MSEETAKPKVDELSARLEEERQRAAGALEELRTAHQDELRREREAKEGAIATAESRLAEIEKRVEDAERRAAGAEAAVADEQARARESAAAWLREQVEAIRREARR